MLFVEDGGVEYGGVGGVDEFKLKMLSIKERKTSPTENLITSESSIILLDGESIKTIVVTSVSEKDHPGSTGVVKTVRVDSTVEERVHALVSVNMSLHVEIDFIIVEDLFKGFLPCGPGRWADLSVPRTVKVNNNPRSLSSINLLEISNEPINLFVETSERSIVVGGDVGNRSNESVSEIGFSV